MNGLIKCKVLPNNTLYHPVLPYRLHKRLFFPLCRTCAEELNQGDCNHSIDERSFIGTFVLDEVRLALEMGYRVLECYEIWEYEITKYNPKTGEGGLFHEYVNNFFKIKEMASGLPSHLKTEEEIENYILDFFIHEGIQLERSEMRKNPGLRFLAKLLLNCLWGRFALAENKAKTTVVSNPEELYQIICDNNITVNIIEEASPNMFYVNWQYIDEEYEVNGTVNSVIAAYTTAWGRIRLYRLLVKLGNAVAYYDTDSAAIKHDPGCYLPPTGDFLGDLTDEIAIYGENSKIIEWVALAPKCYSYKVAIKGDLKNIKTITKVKGFCLNHETSKVVNFDCLKKQVHKLAGPQNVIQKKKIRRLRDHTVVSEDQTKTLKLTYCKRKIVENFDTVPYGFKRIRCE